MRSLGSAAVFTASFLLITACGRGDDVPDAEGAEPASDTLAGMEGMPGMQMGSASMMDRMSTHMAMMRGTGGDSMIAMLATHRQMVANMIAQMNREMRDMQMPGNAGWNATVDSLRSDLTRMPEMSQSELQAMMPEHDRRVMRLMEMHRTMMSGMGRAHSNRLNMRLYLITS